jgi:hypothetical protein
VKPCYDQIPEELRARPNWVVWRLEKRADQRGVVRETKVPYSARSEKHAKSNDPSTWSSFGDAEAALERGYAGLGFCLTPPYIGVDLDGCRQNEINEPWAEVIIRELNSYAEISPSGCGVRVIVKGDLPDGRRQMEFGDRDHHGVGLYDAARGRYLTMTGCRISGDGSIAERTAELHRIHARLFPPQPPKAKPKTKAGASLADDDLIARALKASDGGKFSRLWNGQWEGEYASQSEADLALCMKLAFWTNRDPGRMDALFRRSGLMRDKWEREDYRERTIRSACDMTTEVWESRSNGYHRPVMAANPPAESDVDACAAEAEAPLNPRRPIPPRERRRICSNGRLLDIKSAEGREALRAANDPPFLFGRAGSMVSVGPNERQQQVILKVDHRSLRGHLARAADYYKIVKGEEVDCSPPGDMVEYIHALAPGEWGFPPLDGVTDSPVLRPDFSVLQTPGYDPATMLYYAPDPALQLPVLPERPTNEDIDGARSQIFQMIGEFPFENDASKANMVAALLTPIVRPAIQGSVPMALLDAPQAGSGKSLLCDVVSIIATGQVGRMFSAPKDEDEWRKVITTALLSGGAVIVFDNVTRPLENGDLCSALTASIWADRAMKTHDTLALPVRTTFMASGNNIRIGGDMPRRCYRIRLDPKCSQPYLRTGPAEGKDFTIADLKAWTAEHRSELLAALLTLARAWFVAGQPKPNVKALGSFEKWTIIVGGILQHAGIDGFMANAEAVYAEADEESTQWEAFLLTLHDLFPDPFLAAQVADELKGTTLNPQTNMPEPSMRALKLKSALPEPLLDVADKDERFRRKLGTLVGQRVDRRYGQQQIHLVRAAKMHGNQQWQVVLGGKLANK